MSFGQIEVGKRSSPQVLTFTYSLDYPITMTELDIGDPNFVLANDGCTGTLLSYSDTCALGLVFAPRVAGESSTSIEVLFQHDCTSRNYFPCSHEPPAPNLDVNKNFDLIELSGNRLRVEWSASLFDDEGAVIFTGIGV